MFLRHCRRVVLRRRVEQNRLCMLASVSHVSARARACSLNFGNSLAISISTRARLRQSSENCMLRTLRMSTNDLIKINAFAAPAHIEFRLTGRVI